MKITKFVHSCLLVETSERVALFDPGSFSAFDVGMLNRLDDVFITHEHFDHMDLEFIKKLQARFPHVRVTAPADAKTKLDKAGVIGVTSQPPEGVSVFDAPHEKIRPYFEADPPQELGYHYLGLLTDPGDSHSFHETMPILALPVTAPWGSVVNATSLVLQLKPKFVIPIHDWHWRDEARQGMYEILEQRLDQAGIIFIKPINGQPVEINL